MALLHALLVLAECLLRNFATNLDWVTFICYSSWHTVHAHCLAIVCSSTGSDSLYSPHHVLPPAAVQFDNILLDYQCIVILDRVLYSLELDSVNVSNSIRSYGCGNSVHKYNRRFHSALVLMPYIQLQIEKLKALCESTIWLQGFSFPSLNQDIGG